MQVNLQKAILSELEVALPAGGVLLGPNSAMIAHGYNTTACVT